MLWPRDNFHLAYNRIKREAALSSGCTVFILVAPDIDALCACHILTYLLRNDFISFTLIPVDGYHAISRLNEEKIQQNDNLRSIVLINCGAMIPLHKIFFANTSARDIQYYVIDSHRPMHLSNVYDQGQIILFDDEAQAEDDLPSDGSDLDPEDYEEEDSEDDSVGSSSASEEEFDENQSEEEELETDEKTTSAKRESEDQKNADDPFDNIENEPMPNENIEHASSDDDGQVEKEPHRDHEDVGHVENTEDDDPFHHRNPTEKLNRRRQILNYYRGSFHGAPAATLMYDLACQLMNPQNDLLWFAIIGLSKQFVAQEIDTDNYMMFIQKFMMDVQVLNKASEDMILDDDTIIPSNDDGLIEFEEEYRFMLYRHWNLYDSMYHSNYVASHLGIWKASGRDELEIFLAKMGMSLRQCKQRFAFMSVELKDQLEMKIKEIAPEFGLDDIFYGSFHRQFGKSSRSTL